jgi:hypothetical protein
MASAKKYTKDAFSVAASSSKHEDSYSDEEDDKDEKAFMKSFMATCKSSPQDKKFQKNKRKRSELVAFKPKCANIGFPTTEVIGETTVNGIKKP